MPSSTKSWVDKRIDAINRNIARSPNPKAMSEGYICEVARLHKTKCNKKKEYKAGISINGNK